MSLDALTLSGLGLHSGARCTVRLLRRAGPLLVEQGDVSVGLAELGVTRADRGVTVGTADGALSIDLCEHLFAALAALQVRTDLTLQVSGPELPLLDGGARLWVAALTALGLPRSPQRLRVVQAGSVERSGARYDFSPGDATSLSVTVTFPGVGEERARWDGSARRFSEDIAPARTFGYASEGEALRARRRARWVDPSAVLVLDDEGATLGDVPREPNELARHKLLDLLGDWYLHGGPPLGVVHATRPGHAANHAAIALALDHGLVARM